MSRTTCERTKKIDVIATIPLTILVVGGGSRGSPKKWPKNRMLLGGVLGLCGSAGRGPP